jgi:hypothetical protein
VRKENPRQNILHLLLICSYLSYLTNSQHLLTYFQILIRFLDKSELKIKLKKSWKDCLAVLPTGRLFACITQKRPNKNLSRIFPPEWPKSSTKRLQHCCGWLMFAATTTSFGSPKYVNKTRTIIFAAKRFNRFHRQQVAVSRAVSVSFPAYGRN